MKCVIAITFIYTLILGCDSAEKKAYSKESTKLVFDCFSHIDTINTGQAKGCENYIFKMIGNKYVLMIACDPPAQFDSCIHVIIDSSNSEKLVRLFVYDKRKANLFTYCNDIGNGDVLRTLAKASGDIYLKFSPPDNKKYLIHHDFRVSAWVNKLVFFDSFTNENITINKEFFFDVPNMLWFGG
jgi:hypothetical protein